ncbi:MAG: MerR family DNA-binding transcriptional regulator [Firmicutes bacterium]|nr:MerR family DNA-binding transcriptional regulator [Bacillota bacterium]
MITIEHRLYSSTPKTLQRWEKAKLIPSEQTPTGYRRYRADEVMRLITQRPMGFSTRCVIDARVFLCQTVA